jgi:hypothetical protein
LRLSRKRGVVEARYGYNTGILRQEGAYGVDTLNKSMQQTETLNAVYDDDLMDVLKELGVHKDFAQGKLRCAFCGDTITWENLYSLFPDRGAVRFSCNKPECVKQLVSRVEDEKIG